ncbi:hypothetical protein Y1Q_0014844 [Alligator mississippiensis]|uniref:Uncharacterized protein n=1 Tax=Alligator mississippiensis TaxID=8496 RepID=A0A151M245_ALLMI|nr:hypothetical protein Y1Q_0014844 [Alligator mississippiensis]
MSSEAVDRVGLDLNLQINSPSYIVAWVLSDWEPGIAVQHEEILLGENSTQLINSTGMHLTLRAFFQMASIRQPNRSSGSSSSEVKY